MFEKALLSCDPVTPNQSPIMSYFYNIQIGHNAWNFTASITSGFGYQMKEVNEGTLSVTYT